MNDTGNAPAAPTPATGTPAPASVAAPSPTVAPISREQVRSSILQDAASGIEQIVAAGSVAPTSAVASAAATDPATAAAAAGATAAPKPDEGIEIHPESGPSPELGSLKLRFKGTDGTYTPVPKDLATQKFELEVGGKTIVKDLPGIARLAADGIANQRHASENHQIRTQVIPQFEQQVGSLQQQLDAQIALNREILGDEGRYAARRQEFMELNTPEQRADRAERALEERDRRETQRAESQEHVTYYKANVLPALVNVFAESPTVSNEEVMGRIQLETSHMLVNGVVPPESYPKFVAYLQNSLAPWAKGLHAQRSQADTAQRDAEQRAAKERETAAQRERQLATRDVGALVPANPASGAPAATASTQPPPRSRAEARRQIIESAGALTT